MQDIRKQLQRHRDDIDAVRDLGDHVEQQTRREMGFMTRQRLVARLQRVQAALERLKRGVYGVCVECGASIAPKRLRGIPEAETCVPCQERMERQSRAAA